MSIRSIYTLKITHIVAQENENSDHERYAAQSIADSIYVVAHRSNLASLATNMSLHSRYMSIQIIQERTDLK